MWDLNIERMNEKGFKLIKTHTLKSNKYKQTSRSRSASLPWPPLSLSLFHSSLAIAGMHRVAPNGMNGGFKEVSGSAL